MVSRATDIAVVVVKLESASVVVQLGSAVEQPVSDFADWSIFVYRYEYHID